MKMKSTLPITVILSASLFAAQTAIAADNRVYADFPITLKDYSGKKTNSVSYSGQAARHAIHDSLKKLASKGNGTFDAKLAEEMLSYFEGEETGCHI